MTSLPLTRKTPAPACPAKREFPNAGDCSCTQEQACVPHRRLCVALATCSAAGHSFLMDTHPCWTLISAAGHSSLLVTHPCWSLIPAGHSHPCWTLIPAGHSSLLLVIHPCWILIPSGHSSLLVIHPCWSLISAGCQEPTPKQETKAQ